MAEMKNSPDSGAPAGSAVKPNAAGAPQTLDPNQPQAPSLVNQPKGFDKAVSHVRITPTGQHENYDFKGKTYEKGGKAVPVGQLGLSNMDIAAIEADPNFIVEKFDKDGYEVKANGKRPKALSRNAGARAVARDGSDVNEISDTKPKAEGEGEDEK